MTAATEVVTTFLAALRLNDMKTCYSLFDPNAVIDEAMSLPYGGMRHGPGIFRDLARDVARDFVLDLGEPEIHEAGPRVVIIYDVTLTSRRTGQTATMPVADFYTVENGLITRLDVFYKDTHKVVEIHGAESATDKGSSAP